MKILEQFLIGLGLQVDKKSFDAGTAAFDGISKSVIQLGGILATKLGIQKVVGDFTNAGVALDNFNKLNGASVQNVQRLGYALKQQGGNAEDAFSMIKNIQNLMASPLTGNTGWMGEAARFGLDPRAITDAKSTKDAILNVADAFEHMNQVQQVQASFQIIQQALPLLGFVHQHLGHCQHLGVSLELARHHQEKKPRKISDHRHRFYVIEGFVQVKTLKEPLALGFIQITREKISVAGHLQLE